MSRLSAPEIVYAQLPVQRVCNGFFPHRAYRNCRGPGARRPQRSSAQQGTLFLEAPQQWRDGYDISRTTGVKSGTFYPILMRMADRKLLETRWSAHETGKLPRHMYGLTPAARQLAREMLHKRLERGVLRTALGEAKSIEPSVGARSPDVEQLDVKHERGIGRDDPSRPA